MTRDQAKRITLELLDEGVIFLGDMVGVVAIDGKKMARLCGVRYMPTPVFRTPAGNCVHALARRITRLPNVSSITYLLFSEIVRHFLSKETTYMHSVMLHRDPDKMCFWVLVRTVNRVL